MSSSCVNLLNKCLSKKSPGQSLFIASLGCTIGSFLVILSFQIFADFQNLTHKKNGSFITLNKQVSGGLLLNLDQTDKNFSPDEVARISNLDGVTDVAGFSRNHFPVTVNIWPTGKIGLGAAARADLFFESIPDRFLDQKPEVWKWEENQSIVPIMVPKFYLNLWNFGLAPSRSEYPALSIEAASSMPVEIFIGEDQSVRMMGRFVAFSKRINSILVPQNFLKWANSRYAKQESEKYFFLWKDNEILAPPVSLSEIRKTGMKKSAEITLSEIGKPGKKLKLGDVLNQETRVVAPARLIVRTENSKSDTFYQNIEQLGYETNRENPHSDWINKTTSIIIWSMGGLGGLLSFLSMATFTGCYRLMVVNSSRSARDLFGLGFSSRQISSVFQRRFDRAFITLWGVSFLSVYITKIILVKFMTNYGLELHSGLNLETCLVAIIYAVAFMSINHAVIKRTIDFSILSDPS